jgi:hypothetical protein
MLMLMLRRIKQEQENSATSAHSHEYVSEALPGRTMF